MRELPRAGKVTRCVISPTAISVQIMISLSNCEEVEFKTCRLNLGHQTLSTGRAGLEMIGPNYQMG